MTPGSIIVIIFSAAIFLAMILILALKQAYTGRIIRLMLVLVGILGLIIYGYGYSCVSDNQIMAVFKTVFAVLSMYIAKVNLSDIITAPAFQNQAILMLSWIIHIFAVFSFAGAIISLIGTEVLRKLRMLMATKNHRVIIYGTNKEALKLGRELAGKNGTSVIFTDTGVSADTMTAINIMSAAQYIDPDASVPSVNKLKKYGISRDKKLTLYCMKEEEENIAFARAMKKVLNEIQMSPKLTSVVVFAGEPELGMELQNFKNKYGYGNVSIVERDRELARMMIRKCPPYTSMKFDENGRALNNFEALFVGFGMYGQTLLKEVICQSQFAGSHFKATIIDPNYEKTNGYLKKQSAGIFTEYDIRTINADGRSETAFTYIEENLDHINYIIVSIGIEKTCHETAKQIVRFIRSKKCKTPVILCGKSEIEIYRTDSANPDRFSLISAENLDFAKLDATAMRVNNRYAGGDESTLWDNWERCDYFSRMSCRAFADYVPAVLNMLHMTKEESVSQKAEGLKLTSEQYKTVGEAEHMRWCAFHFANGYTTMSNEEWERRASQYLEEKKNGNPSIRLGKDTEQKKHACLVKWDDLDILSDKEKRITGIDPDYKQKDIENILEIPNII